MSLVLLIGAGLFLRTLHNLRSVDVGFNANNLLMFRINPQANRYESARIPDLYARTAAALSALPGVQSVAFTRTTLLSGGTSTTGMHIRGKPGQNDIHVMSVSPDFFKTLEIPVLIGRGFTEHDAATPQATVMINETAVKKFFAGENPIGQRIGSNAEEAEAGKTEIIGVIKDTKYNSLREPAPATLYRVHQRNATAASVIARTAGDPSGMIETVRAAMRQVDPELPLTGMTTQTDQIEGRVEQERLFALAYSLFGGLALLLACIGLFGLMSYNVSRRTERDRHSHRARRAAPRRGRHGAARIDDHGRRRRGPRTRRRRGREPVADRDPVWPVAHRRVDDGRGDLADDRGVVGSRVPTGATRIARRSDGGAQVRVGPVVYGHRS